MPHKKPSVNIANAKEGEYREIIRQIAESESGCGFCSDNFPKYHKHPILKTIGKWMVTRNSWPYANARHHFLLRYEDHTDNLADLAAKDWADLGEAFRWLISEFNLPGGAVMMRFMDPNFSGASVPGHLHAFLVVPDVDNTSGETTNRPIAETEFDQHPYAVWFRIG